MSSSTKSSRLVPSRGPTDYSVRSILSGGSTHNHVADHTSSGKGEGGGGGGGWTDGGLMHHAFQLDLESKRGGGFTFTSYICCELKL